MIELKSEESLAFSQSLASKSMLINPYSNFVKEAKLTLSPSMDSWVDSTSIDMSDGTVVQTVNLGWGNRNYLASSVSSTKLSSSKVVLNEAVTYMRNTQVQFKGENYIPNSEGLELWFDGKKVSAYVLEPKKSVIKSVDISSSTIVPVMTSDNTPSPFVVTTSNNPEPGYRGYKAFDRVMNTTYSSGGKWVAWANEMPAWLKIDLGQVYMITSYAVTGSNASWASPQSFKLEGSVNNSTIYIYPINTIATTL